MTTFAAKAGRLSVAAVTLLWLVVGLPGRAAGDLITWQFQGEVEAANPGPMQSLIPVGMTLALAFTLDTSAPDLCSQPDVGFYRFGLGSVTVGGVTHASTWSALEADNPAGNCMGPGGGYTLRMIDFVGAPFYSASVWWGPGAEIVPTVAPQEVGFSLAYMCIVCADEWGTARQVPVPEPGTLALLGLGLLAASGARRRRDGGRP